MMAPAIFPDSVSTTAVSAPAKTEESPTPYDADALGTFPAELYDCMAAPAPTTSAALFSIVRRPMPVPWLDCVPDPLLFFIVRSLIIGLLLALQFPYL
jgi:hypothetical protein